MNMVKLLSPDFAIGKVLVAGRSILEIGALLAARPSTESIHLARLIMQVKPAHTMVRNQNLINLYRMVRYLNRSALPGAIVECGVWNGGSSAMMAAACRDTGVPRSFWLFDSFEGLPRPTENDNAIERDSYFEGWNKGSIENVERIFRKLELPLNHVHFVKGWFDQTIPVATVDQIALLHIDADWYESVSLVLNQLYDRITPGGYVVFDDYGYWEGCDRAAHDFLDSRGMPRAALHRVGSMGAYFQKPA
ncbi:macrocin O-methyltransferase [Chloroflexales bacterium ZM16-3]|nr:macrocin O-methyltransferase [Chloroflexales bacterium ZM16-3]